MSRMPSSARPTAKKPSARGRSPGRSRAPAADSFVINVDVRDVMSRHPVTVGPDATLLDALGQMSAQTVPRPHIAGESWKLEDALTEGDIPRTLKTPRVRH